MTRSRSPIRLLVRLLITLLVGAASLAMGADPDASAQTCGYDLQFVARADPCDIDAADVSRAQLSARGSGLPRPLRIPVALLRTRMRDSLPQKQQVVLPTTPWHTPRERRSSTTSLSLNTTSTRRFNSWAAARPS